MIRNIIIPTLLLFLLISSCGGGSKSVEKDKKQKMLENQKSLAVASIKRRNFRQAIEDIEEAERINNKDSEVYLIKGAIYFGLKDYEQAEKYYKKSIKLDKENSEARFTLCGLYIRLGKLDEAIEQCEIAADDPLYNARASAYTNLGIAYFRKGDVNRAKEYYDKALQINPSFVYTRNELGKLYLSIGKEDEAIREFKMAINGFPSYEEAHFNLGLAYLKSGNKISACESFSAVIKIAPGSTYAINSRDYLVTICDEKYYQY